MQSLSPRTVDSVVTIVTRGRPSTMTSRLWYRAPLSDGRIGARFFSPAAIAAVPQLIVACGAQLSPPPHRIGATMLAGSEADWELLPYELH